MIIPVFVDNPIQQVETHSSFTTDALSAKSSSTTACANYYTSQTAQTAANYYASQEATTTEVGACFRDSHGQDKQDGGCEMTFEEFLFGPSDGGERWTI